MLLLHNQLTLLVKSRWNTPHSWTYFIPLAIPNANRIFIAGERYSALFCINCSSEPSGMYSVKAWSWPSWTQTPIKLSRRRKLNIRKRKFTTVRALSAVSRGKIKRNKYFTWTIVSFLAGDTKQSNLVYQQIFIIKTLIELNCEKSCLLCLIKLKVANKARRCANSIKNKFINFLCLNNGNFILSSLRPKHCFAVLSITSNQITTLFSTFFLTFLNPDYKPFRDLISCDWFIAADHGLTNSHRIIFYLINAGVLSIDNQSPSINPCKSKWLPW